MLATGSEGSEVSEVEEDLWVYDSEVCAWLECSSIHSPDSEFVDVETEIGLETPRSPSFALDHQRRDSSRPGTLVDLTPRQRTLEVEDAEQRSMPPRYESSWLEIDSEDEDAGAILGIKRKMMRQFRTAIRSRRRRL